MLQKLAFLLLFTIQAQLSFAQTTFTGVVTDAGDGTTLPYVNIGIRGKNIGTSSLSDGTYVIQIPAQHEKDTLIFSSAGYEQVSVPIKDIPAGGLLNVSLNSKIIDMKGMAIIGKRVTEKKFGVKNNSLLRLGDGSMNQNDIFEIAQLVKFDSKPSKITSVNLYINEARKDSGTFRINFYAFEDNKPAKSILEKSIIQKHEIREGWLKFDLDAYDISMKGDFIIAIEFLPASKKTGPVFYGIKIGGGTRSYVRTSSQGTWSMPPHQYRLFVTALVANDKSKLPEETEEKETLPSATIFSRQVQDSFSIFIRLPDDYNNRKNKKFPVVYLLDANLFFDNVTLTMKTEKSNAILVGIGYKDFIKMDSLRNRDYTFPKALEKYGFFVSGGADKFLSFIKLELTRFIDTTYRTDTLSRTLMGHSLGAYFTLYTLQEELNSSRACFSNYVAASPSLHYNDGYIMDQFEVYSAIKDVQRKQLLLTVGAKEEVNDEDKEDKSELENFNRFNKILTDGQFQNIELKTIVYPAYGHMETAIPTFNKALDNLKKQGGKDL